MKKGIKLAKTLKKICKTCGKDFMTSCSWAKYDSKECRYADYWKIQAEKKNFVENR